MLSCFSQTLLFDCDIFFTASPNKVESTDAGTNSDWWGRRVGGWVGGGYKVKGEVLLQFVVTDVFW